MFEVLTQILLLVGLFLFLRFVFLSFIPRNVLTWLGGIVLVLVLVLALLEPSNRTIGIAWSILSFPLRPLGLSLVLLASSLRFGVKKLSDGNLVLIAFLVLLVCSLPVTAYLLTAQTEQRSVVESIDRRSDTAEDVGNVQAIVVLNEGTMPTDPSYRIRTQINNTTQGFGTNLSSRLSFTATLYDQQQSRGNQPLVIVNTGPDPEVGEQGVRTSQGVTELLANLGVPTDVVRLDTTSVDARTSALSVRQLFNDFGFERGGTIMLVAPALSIRRAASTFAQVGFDVIPRPTDFFVFQLQGGLQLAALTDLIPSVEALVITTRVVDEYLATIYYFLRGWLVDPLGL